MSWTGTVGAGAAKKAEPRPTGPIYTHANPGDYEHYARAAFDREVARVTNAVEGERNVALNTAAFCLGQLVGAGVLTESTVIDALTAAALQCGLEQTETRKTIASGIESGKKEPRDMPEPKAKSNGANGAVPPDDYEYTDDDAPDAPPHDDGKQRNEIPFSLLTAEQIWAPLEEPDYLVSQILRRGTLTQIVSYGGSGKTWLAVDLTLAVGAGVPFLDRFDAQQGTVTYLDYENGSYEMRRRLQAVARARGLATPVAGVDVCPVPDVYMSDPKFGKRIEALAAQRDLVIVDTLKAANPSTDENSSEMRVGLDHMRRAAERHGSAFVILVHGKKSGPFAVDPREAGRGSSAIFDAADTVLHVQYTKGEPLRVIQTKARLGRVVDPFVVHIDDHDGGVLVRAENAPKDESTTSDKFEKHCSEVLQCLQHNPSASKRLLMAKLGKHFNTITAALEMLERHGAAKSVGSGKTERWFAVERAGGDEDDD